MGLTKKETLSKKDFEICSLWKFDEDELFEPVHTEADFPECVSDLYFKANFTLKNNMKFEGYIIGFGKIHAIGIFIGETKLILNRNLINFAEHDIKKTSELIKKRITPEDFSPVKYITDFNFLDIENFEGEFDLLKPMTNEERLWQYNVEK